MLKSGTAILGLEEPCFDKTTGMPSTLVTSKVPLRDANGEVIAIIGIGFDITERKLTEQRLAASEHLESIGRLAAGVAHEINTPIQFLNDSVYFVREAMQDLMAENEKLRAALGDRAEKGSDVEDLKTDLPPALDRIADGLGRIAEIVRSMKEFSHADQREMSQVDLNRAINSTLVIARSEYKYVAEVKTEFGELPQVTCHGGQINQVILNLIVNAAHAIADIVKGTSDKGLITVKTFVEDDFVVVSIGDTGGGIPEAIRKRIFEPFFTTKEVGRGTGQGLSIAHRVVTVHGGTLDFQTEIGVGTTFFVRLPVSPAESAAKVA
jgi:two-component system, NtrC family, sensor kinase